ncbi:MAG: ATP-binding protein [Rhodospirillales bacterium]|nr:ATP-binding protein [Rhodospirillales bacterium]
MLILIAAASVAAAAIAAIAVWRASTPLSMFAAAAERLGRDLDAEPLSEAGPEEVARAARAFNAMQARLQQMVRRRTRMLAALSHDLRTPLTRLRLRAELLDDREQQGKFRADLDQIEALVTTSLEYVRDAFRDERPGPLDLAVLVQTACDEVEDAGGAVRYRGPEHVAFVARPVALRRAVANLIDNAIKYGREAEVSLVLPSADEPGPARIIVEDRGPGLAEAELERAFEPFYRGEGSRSRETGGSGLGLAIARAAAEAHGGAIALANRAGGGLCATLSLPRSTSPGRAAAHA